MLKIRLPRRYLVILLCSLSVIISYADRSNISIAIIPMSEEYQFSKERQGLILSSFFYGYLMTQILGGYLAFKFGGKSVLALAAILWSIFTFITPFASDHGMVSLIFCRVALGLGEGLGFPAIHAMISTWIPPNEQSTAVSTVTASSYIGSIAALLISSPVAKNLSWRYIFYIFGVFGLTWNIPWHWYGASSPRLSKSISAVELQYIETQKKSKHSTSTTALVDETSHDRYLEKELQHTEKETPIMHKIMDEEDALESSPLAKRRKDNASITAIKEKDSNEDIPDVIAYDAIPWKKILSSKEVWAILINQFCNSWGFYVLLTWLPSYYKDMYQVDLADLGYFTVIPYIVQGAIGFLSGILGDFMFSRLHFSIHFIRQTAQCTGMLGTAFFLLLGAYVAKSAVAGATCITFALGINALTLIGVSISPHDIAPKYAGIIFGMGNTAATIPGILGVYISGLLLEQSGKNWDMVFTLAAMFYVIGTVSWIFMAGGNRVVIP